MRNAGRIFALAPLVLLAVACGGKVYSPECLAEPCDGAVPTSAPTATGTAESPPASSSAPPSPAPSVPPSDPTDCPAPYMVHADDGRCVWSCSEGTTPSRTIPQCVCQPGKVEVDEDAFGRRICR